MTGESYILGYVAIAICLIACILHIATISHVDVRGKPLMVAGKRIQAAGYFILVLRLWFLPLYPVPLGVVAIILLALGTIFTTFQRVVDACDNAKKDAYFQRIGGR